MTMPDNELNSNAFSSSSIHGITIDCFNELNDEQKNIVLAGNNDTIAKDKDAGMLGRFLGSNTKNAVIHITLLICAVLLLICLADMIHAFATNKTITFEIWNLVFPIITLSIGYIFGKSDKE